MVRTGRRTIPENWHGTLIAEKQDASGLYYRRNRYYDPASGRFTQEDPIGLAGGLNVYGFAAGDPVNFDDPFGLSHCPKGQVDVKGECVPVLTGTPPLVTPAGALGGLRRAGAAIGSGRRSLSIMRQARTVLRSGELATLRAAAQAGRAAEVQIAGRTVVYEPGLSASGMTLFSESGFVLGRQAFSSQTELTKTVLHELFRLNTSGVAAGIGTATAAELTQDAIADPA